MEAGFFVCADANGDRRRRSSARQRATASLVRLDQRPDLPAATRERTGSAQAAPSAAGPASVTARPVAPLGQTRYEKRVSTIAPACWG